MVAGIDVIGTTFERLDHQTPVPKRRDQPRGHSGFADVRGCAGNDDARYLSRLLQHQFNTNSKLDTRLRTDLLVLQRVLDERHFRNEIGTLNEPVRRVAAGQDHVCIGRPQIDPGENLFE